MPNRPWLLAAAAALLAAGGALIGADARPVAAGVLIALGCVALGAWLMDHKDQ